MSTGSSRATALAINPEERNSPTIGISWARSDRLFVRRPTDQTSPTAATVSVGHGWARANRAAAAARPSSEAAIDAFGRRKFCHSVNTTSPMPATAPAHATPRAGARLAAVMTSVAACSPVVVSASNGGDSSSTLTSVAAPARASAPAGQSARGAASSATNSASATAGTAESRLALLSTPSGRRRHQPNVAATATATSAH